MNIWLYALIFSAKVVENALGTIRIIVVANGRKFTGAVLQFIIALVWVLVTGSVLIGITEDPLKIFFFALGSLVGSYAGSILEEKLAMGSNTLMAIVNSEISEVICDTLRELGFAITSIKGRGKDKARDVLIVVVNRKRRDAVVKVIHKLDDEAMIISENVTTITGGYIH